MEPVTSWSNERVIEWLKGLDAPLQEYSFSEWHLSGSDLLHLSSTRLEKLGVHKIGHQELILEAAEKLCALTYSVGGDNLRSLTEKLRAVAHTLQMSIQGRWRINTNDGQSATKLSQQVLQALVDVITASNGLVSLLNRYQFAQQTGYTANEKVATLCKDLDITVHKETAVFEKEKDIISICRQLVAVCDEILTVTPLPLLTHTAQLESVDLVTASPGDQNTVLYITINPVLQSSTEICEKILAGDEVLQVNGQIVVGWSRANLVQKLEENPNGVTLVLRRLPGFLKQEEEEEEEEKNRYSLLGRVAASDILYHPLQNNDTTLIHMNTLGTRTALSRRRVSCRELGRPDCDGWLWKKRKETNVFMTQKWQRFWFVLKGPTLYWYTSRQEEKAEGLIKIGSYSIESAGEHKRKYVFQMCHQRFQNFFFAADNVTDMSKWINCLITAIQKHKKFVQNQPDSEEECYSETESEEESSRSPLSHRKKVNTVRENRHTKISLWLSGKVDEMDEMFHSLKKGGVSLTGQNQPTTHDQLRKSFIKRNKNPVINEKIHTLRALQSTLKAKEAELHLIDKILEDSVFSPQNFRQWKKLNEELLQDIERQYKHTDSPSIDTVSKAKDEASTLNLSDGEQLVDAETSDDRGSTSTEAQVPMQTHTTVTDKTTENYFYI
uniref:Connector enhancer of kinase suppressor of Ras 1 n=1 Tax=Cyprinus carpio TaxID=7962 RepID=A0A8C1KBW1_CYPCA